MKEKDLANLKLEIKARKLMKQAHELTLRRLSENWAEEDFQRDFLEVQELSDLGSGSLHDNCLYSEDLTMPKQKKVDRPVTVTTVIEEAQHEALRALAYQKHMPMATPWCQALDEFLKKQGRHAEAKEHDSKPQHPTKSR